MCLSLCKSIKVTLICLYTIYTAKSTKAWDRLSSQQQQKHGSYCNLPSWLTLAPTESMSPLLDKRAAHSSGLQTYFFRIFEMIWKSSNWCFPQVSWALDLRCHHHEWKSGSNPGVGSWFRNKKDCLCSMFVNLNVYKNVQDLRFLVNAGLLKFLRNMFVAFISIILDQISGFRVLCTAVTRSQIHQPKHHSFPSQKHVKLSNCVKLLHSATRWTVFRNISESQVSIFFNVFIKPEPTWQGFWSSPENAPNPESTRLLNKVSAHLRWRWLELQSLESLCPAHLNWHNMSLGSAQISRHNTTAPVKGRLVTCHRKQTAPNKDNE